MNYKLEYIKETNLIFFKASGGIDLNALKSATLEIQDLILKNELWDRKVWNDTRGCDVQINFKEFEAFLDFHEQNLIHEIKVNSARSVFLVDQPVLTAFVTTFRNRTSHPNIKRELFTTEASAKEWLFQAD